LARNQEYPIEEIKARYECQGYNEKISLPDLAEEYDCSEHYLYKLSSQNNWHKGKYIDEVEEAVKEDLVEEAKQKEKILRDRYNSILDYLMDKVEEDLFADTNDFNNMKYYKKAVSTVKELRSEHWEVNRIEEFNQQVKQQFNQLNDGSDAVTIDFDDLRDYIENKEQREDLETIAETKAEMIAEQDG